MMYRKQLLTLGKSALDANKFTKLEALNEVLIAKLGDFPELPMAHTHSREALMEAANMLLDNRGSQLSHSYLCNALFAVAVFVEDEDVSDACHALEVEIDAAINAQGNTTITLDTFMFPEREGPVAILDDERSINADLTSYALVLIRTAWLDFLLYGITTG